jgi:hypothetical protein
MPDRLFWCVGLYASGSTWLFNIAKKIAALSDAPTKVASAFVADHAQLAFPWGTQIGIVKTHETDEAAALALRQHSEAIWLTLRDPRDSVASLITYQDCSFDEALDLVAAASAYCLPLLKHPRAKIFRFEDNYFDDRSTLSLVAADLGQQLATETTDRIFRETRRPAIEAYIARFPEIATVISQPEPGHFVDLETQWHTHHAGRVGTVGRWRSALSPLSIVAVERRLADAMNGFGYRPEFS